MNFSNIFSAELTKALGLTLVDSLWQGAIVLVLAFVLLLLTSKSSPRLRYRILVAAMLLLPVLSVFSFFTHYEPSSAGSQLAMLPEVEMTNPISTVEIAVGPEGTTVSAVSSWEKFMSWIDRNAHWVGYFWVIGLALFAIRFFGGLFYVRLLSARSTKLENSAWNHKLSRFSQELGIRAKVQLKESARITSPLVMGYLKPIIVFPLGLIQALPTDQIEAILVHELAHIKRLDYLVNLLLSVLQIIYFFHPAYWWLYKQADAEREYHCDALALEYLGDKLALVKALTSIQELQFAKMNPAMGFAGRKNQLLVRIERIVDQRSKTNWLSGLISFLLILTALFAVSFQSIGADNDTSPVNPEEISSEALFNPAMISDTIPKSKNNRLDTVLEGKGTFSVEVDFDLKDTIPIRNAMREILNDDGKISVQLGGGKQIKSVLRDGKKLRGKELDNYTMAFKIIMRYDIDPDEVDNWLGVIKADELRMAREEQALRDEEMALADKIRGNERARLEELQSDWNSRTDSEALQREIDALRSLEKNKNESYQALKRLVESNGDIDYLSELEKLAMDKELSELEQDKQYEKLKKDYDALRSLAESRKEVDYLEELRMLEKLKKEEESLRSDFVEPDAVMEMTTISPNKAVWNFGDHPDKEEYVENALSTIQNSNTQPLYELDGKLVGEKEMNDLDHSQIAKIEVIKGRAAQLMYPEEMKSKAGLVRIATRTYAKTLAWANRNKEYYRKEERLSRQMLQSLEEDELIEAGWESIKLSTKELRIDGKKLARKWHKKYLNLYEESYGSPLIDGLNFILEGK